eukprot:29950-Pelagomonas_calceolata.AAC.1
MSMLLWVQGLQGYKGKRPRSRRSTASLFINTHETGHPVGDVEERDSLGTGFAFWVGEVS